jgi:hypothetical protein
MLETRIFGAGLFLASLVFIFHGCILLFAPKRYLPMGSWGASTIILVRKPPLDLGKRFVGLCIIVAMLLIFTMPGLLMVLSPSTTSVSWGDSALPHSSVRWDMLAFGVAALLGGYLFWLRPQESVKLLFSSDRTKLEDQTTRRLWTIQTRMLGCYCLLMSLLLFSGFIRSLR